MNQAVTKRLNTWLCFSFATTASQLNDYGDVAIIEAKAYAGKDTSINNGDSVWLGLDTITSVVCTWYINNDIIKQNNGGLWVKPTQTTTYILKTIVCGITTYDTVVVSVKATGIAALTINNLALSIYPNPTSSYFKIGNLKLDIGYLEITDLLGRTIKTITNVKHPITNIQIEDLPSGIYFLKATTSNGTVMNAKFVKE